MKIIIDDKAKKLLREEGETKISLVLENACGWGGKAPEPGVLLGSPEVTEGFEKIIVDEYEVYLSDELSIEFPKVIISSEKYMFSEILTISPSN